MENAKAAYPTTGINRYVTRYLQSLHPAPGSSALDIPSGDGRASAVLHHLGMQVRALDLLPDKFHVDGVACQYADLCQPLPLGDETVDLIVCQEGIEHMPNALAVLEQFNRVLKPGGSLVLTTPNNSHVRARLSRLFVGGSLMRYLPPSEVDSIWRPNPDGPIYFGHLFLLEVNQLWVLSRLAGFEVTQSRKTEVSPSSVALGLILAPLILAATLRAYRASSQKFNPTRHPALQALLWQQVKMNLSATALFCKHIFWVLTKRDSVERCRQQLRPSIRKRATSSPP